jgi:hypothetical protein
MPESFASLPSSDVSRRVSGTHRLSHTGLAGGNDLRSSLT